MARINLLPWRAERRKEQLKQFLSILGLSAFLMILIVVVVHIQYVNLINTQTQRNDYLQREITAVEKQIKEIDDLAKQRKNLLARMEVIQQLQRNRPEIVHLFEEMINVMPDGVHITSLKQSGRNLVINGVAQSNARVSALMRNIDASDWLGEPLLEIIKTDGKSKTDGRNFILKAKQINKTQSENNEGK